LIADFIYRIGPGRALDRQWRGGLRSPLIAAAERAGFPSPKMIKGY